MNDERPDPGLAALGSCELDDDGRREQQARYRRIAAHVMRSERTDDALVIEFGDGLNRELLARTLDVERECCPFFRFELDDTGGRLRVTVEKPDQGAALDAIATVLAPA